jgi:uncharacterized membrane-anchored protein YitT (DUF2179 family)
MNKSIQKILWFILEGKRLRDEQMSRFERAKTYRLLKKSIVRLGKDSILMAAGVFSAAFGLESFLLPSSFIDGGATGIALLINELQGVPLPLLLIILNAPFILLAKKVVNRQFAIKTAVSISCLAMLTAFVPFQVVTQDKLLVAVFGGFFLGAGIGLSVRGGAVIDGTEVLAIFISRKFSTTIGDVIILFNVLIFSIAAYLISVEAALYSMITYLAASKTMDFIIEGIEEYTGVTIISAYSDDIRKMIITELGRGVTVYKGERGFGSHGHRDNIDIVYTVITRLEVSRLNAEIEKLDPNAFVVMNPVKDTKGGMVKKRPLKH